MRIISGKYRGIIIPSPKESIVKPTLDRVKENIFNIMQFRVEKSRCLDLFCGSGALGIECLSRNAEFVDFVDNNKQNIRELEKFLDKIKAQNFSLHNLDFYDALKLFKDENKKFDIIFLDPPFDSDLAQVAIQKIFKFDLLNDKGIIVFEHSLDKINSYQSKVIDSRIYGKIKVDFISK